MCRDGWSLGRLRLSTCWLVLGSHARDGPGSSGPTPWTTVWRSNRSLWLPNSRRCSCWWLCRQYDLAVCWSTAWRSDLWTSESNLWPLGQPLGSSGLEALWTVVLSGHSWLRLASFPLDRSLCLRSSTSCANQTWIVSSKHFLLGTCTHENRSRGKSRLQCYRRGSLTDTWQDRILTPPFQLGDKQ